MKEVRTNRGADINSDYRLMIKLELKWRSIGQATLQEVNIDFFKDASL